MGKDFDNYDALVGMLYEASIESAQWDEPFDLLVKLIDGAGFHFLGWNPTLNVSPFSAVSSSWHDFIGGYHTGWGKVDPHMRATTTDPVGQWLVSHQHFDARFVSRDPYYQEFLLPNDVRHLMGTSVLRGGGMDVVAAVGRSVGAKPFSDDAIALVNRVTPHLQRAVKIHMRTADLRQQAAVGEMGLHAMDSGVLALDSSGRLVFANPFVEKMLQAGTCLKCHSGQLHASKFDDDASLRTAIKRAASTRLPQVLRLRNVNGQAAEGCLVTMVPLAQASWISTALQRPDLLVLVSSPKHRRACSAGDFMELFKLTAAEARLAEGMAEGLDLDAYAVRASISKSTAKAHLKAVFAKTGVRRQPELVRLLGHVAVSHISMT